jgi:nucleoside-diphosphate-sugar epimerase
MPPLPEDDLSAICNLTAPCWEQARNSRIFLTGGTGFFGKWLVESFLAASARFQLNSRLTVLTRNAGAFLNNTPHLANEPTLEFVEGDVRNFRFPPGTFDFVIHAATAANAKQAAEEPLEMFSTIVAGTDRVLQFARKVEARSVLFTSSGAVYGKQPPQISHISEEFEGGPDPLDPASVYGEAKRAAEQLCCLYLKAHRIETKIARGFAFVGPHLPLEAHFAAGNFIADVVNHRDLQIRGDGTPRRSYLYASDLAVWLWTILFRGKPCRAYNVGSEHSVSIRDLAEVVVSALNPAIKICVHQQPLPGNKLLQYVPSTERARKELGLVQTVDLHDAIVKTAQWHGFDSSTRRLGQLVKDA